MAGKIFISYRRGVDSSAAGRLYDRLEMHVGRDRLFMDVDDIPKGVDFVEFLEDQVAQCTHLLAVIGRGWLSAMGRLRDEEDFVRIEIEAALARDGVRVIPVLMEDAKMPAREDLPRALHPFRRRNGLVVPHASFAAVVERELLPDLGESPAGGLSAAPLTPPPAADEEAGCDLIVDQMGRGDFITIAEAVKAAQQGAKIGVRPGRYFGGIKIARPLEIIGLGADREDVMWDAEDEAVVSWTAPGGRVANMSLRLRSGAAYCVDFNGGGGVLESCALTSGGLAIVGIRKGANPVVRGNRIIDGKESGVFVHDQGRGVIEDNDIARNTLSGLEIKTGGDPVVRGNRIVDVKQVGVHVHSQGRGTVEDNEIARNTIVGVSIKSGGDPVVRGNRITGNGYGGVWVRDDGRGTITGNDLRGNKMGALRIDKSAGPFIRENNLED